MKKLNKEQLILLADRLIDDAGKKDPEIYARDRFTGGAVITAYHYGKISYKADLYFGYGKSKNPIHCKMNIDENIAYHVFDAINEKCKHNIEEDTYSVDLLNDIVTTSLRSSTTPYKDKKRKEEDKEEEKKGEDWVIDIMDYYLKLKPSKLDSSRGQAKVNLTKLLKTIPAEDLMESVKNYEIALTAQNRVGTEYAYNSGNFFGMASFYLGFLPGSEGEAEKPKHECPQVARVMEQLEEARAEGCKDKIKYFEDGLIATKEKYNVK